MFRSTSDVAVGDYMRRCLEPIAARLEIDYDEAFFTPPRTDEVLVFDVYRCGLSLLMAFTYPDGWVGGGPLGGRDSRKRARKAAKRMKAALVGDRGPDAISQMGQGYGREMGAFWRRASDSPEYQTEPWRLQESARRSEALGDLAGRYWPTSDPFGALEQIAKAEANRIFDPDNPDAMIDLRAYAGRARAASEAAALALGDGFEEYGSLLLAPVMDLDLDFASGTQADWTFQAETWANLVSDEPLAFGALMQIQNERQGRQADDTDPETNARRPEDLPPHLRNR